MQSVFWWRNRLVLLAFLVAFGLDQISKQVILTVIMQPPRLIEMTGFFRLTLGFNEGASFGMLTGLMGGRPLAMAGVTGLVAAAVIVRALRSSSSTERVAPGPDRRRGERQHP